jgi:hypothetical protein
MNVSTPGFTGGTPGGAGAAPGSPDTARSNSPPTGETVGTNGSDPLPPLSTQITQPSQNKKGGAKKCKGKSKLPPKTSIEAQIAVAEKFLEVADPSSRDFSPLPDQQTFFGKYIAVIPRGPALNAFLKLCDVRSVSDLKCVEPWMETGRPSAGRGPRRGRRGLDPNKAKTEEFINKIKERLAKCEDVLKTIAESKAGNYKKLTENEKTLANKIHRKMAEMMLLWTGLIEEDPDSKKGVFKFKDRVVEKWIGKGNDLNHRNDIMMRKLLEMVNE